MRAWCAARPAVATALCAATAVAERVRATAELHAECARAAYANAIAEAAEAQIRALRSAL
jgi:hypothetical protein